MKKPKLHILPILTFLFAAFLAGFFVGRNVNRTPVQISAVPAATQATEAAPQSSESTEVTEFQPIDVNTATAAQLETLPGIGPVLAQRIIDYRTENGPFRTAGDLMNVSGIGEKKLEAILDLITVGG